MADLKKNGLALGVYRAPARRDKFNRTFAVVLLIRESSSFFFPLEDAPARIFSQFERQIARKVSIGKFRARDARSTRYTRQPRSQRSVRRAPNEIYRQITKFRLYFLIRSATLGIELAGATDRRIERDPTKF